LNSRNNRKTSGRSTPFSTVATLSSLSELNCPCPTPWRVARTLNGADTSGAPFMQSNRMSGPSRKARSAFLKDANTNRLRIKIIKHRLSIVEDNIRLETIKRKREGHSDQQATRCECSRQASMAAIGRGCRYWYSPILLLEATRCISQQGASTRMVDSYISGF